LTEFITTELEARDRRNVERARQIIDDAVEHRLNALVLERRAAEHRNERELERPLADQPLQRGDVGLGAFEIGLHRLVVLLDRHLDQMHAGFGGGILQLVRNLADLELGAEALLEPDDCIVGDQVDDSHEGALDADRKLHHHRTGTEAVLDHVDAHFEIGAGAVELVDEAHPRHFILVRLPPDRFRLRLHAGDAVKHGDRAVEHAQRPFHLDGEVDVARRVDDVDPVLVPEAGRRGRRDRDAALLLLLHPVHRGGALMDLADLVGLAGIIKHTLGGRGLAGVDVRHDADIAIAVERMAASHGVKLRCREGLRLLPEI
jgi:hypothetical protein